jgi:hypothetical protein
MMPAPKLSRSHGVAPGAGHLGNCIAGGCGPRSFCQAEFLGLPGDDGPVVNGLVATRWSMAGDWPLVAAVALARAGAAGGYHRGHRGAAPTFSGTLPQFDVERFNKASPRFEPIDGESDPSDPPLRTISVVARSWPLAVR